jgi:uncharacterized membrane protein
MINTRKQKIICSFSILLNVFLIGMVLSFYLFKPEGNRPPMQGPQPMMQFERAKLALGADGQAIVDQVLEHNKEKMRDDFHALQGLMRDAEMLLTAPELDEKQLARIHKDINTHNGLVKDSFSEMVYEIATKLSAEDRILFFTHALPPKRRGGGEARNPPPPPRH